MSFGDQTLLQEHYLLVNYAVPLDALAALLPDSLLPVSRHGHGLATAMVAVAHMDHHLSKRRLVFSPVDALIAAEVEGIAQPHVLRTYSASAVRNLLEGRPRERAHFQTSVDDDGYLHLAITAGDDRFILEGRALGRWEPSPHLVSERAGLEFCQHQVQPLITRAHPLAGPVYGALSFQACRIDTAEISFVEGFGGELDSVYMLSRNSFSRHSHRQLTAAERLRAHLATLAPRPVALNTNAELPPST